MINRMNATLLYTGSMLLFLLSLVFVGQSIYYQFQLSIYSHNVQFNQAKILYNIALLNQLEKGKSMTTNIGMVKHDGGSYQVILTSKQKYNFAGLKDNGATME